LCLENTQAGKVLPLKYLSDAAAFAKDKDLKLHLDGARIFNAAVKLNVSVKEISQHFDSISFCLSKGLGAPVGSVLCASGEQIKSARRWRKVLGGGMRQAGIVAAAGVFAMENNIDRLSEDHANARLLAEGLAQIKELECDENSVQTNMVFIRLKTTVEAELIDYLKERGIIIAGRQLIRLVTHLDINKEDVRRTVSAFKQFFQSSKNQR
jgi:threonine aldolase